MENATHITPIAGTSLQQVPDLTGQTLGDFQIQRKLGQGGMGEVYLAEQLSLKRKVALKLLKKDLADNEVALKRFKAEAEAVAKATHANIVQVYASGEANGLHFMALEYVEGRNLRDYLARKTPELPLALSILRQVAAALQRASELGIIHRDIKPENILLTRKGEVKVADFGLSRVLEGERPVLNLTQSGVTMGTPLYMSPEQVEGKPLDARTDIYSLGITSYHMFAGEPPFRGATAFEVALQHVREEAIPLASIRPDLPAELCALVHKMMAKAPAERYQSGRELLKDLSRLRESLNGQSGLIALSATGFVDKPNTMTLTPSKPFLARRSEPRNKWLVVVFLLSILTAGGVGAGIALMNRNDDAITETDKEEGETTKTGDEEREPLPAVEATTVKKREQMYLAMINDQLDPAKNFKDPKHGAWDCLEYAFMLLDEGKHRYNEAEELFIRLENIQQVEFYHSLGLLGRAVVFSLRDDYVQSDKFFLKLQERRKKDIKPEDGPKRGGLVMEVLRSHPHLPRWVAEAVHRNSINSKGATDQKLPPFLQPFARRDLKPVFPPREKGPPRKTDKPPLS